MTLPVALPLTLLSRALLKRLGVTRLRPGQREVIESVLSGSDTLAIMPSGAGKSLCFQLPALQLPGTTVVVSPLISLMKDQADKLSDKGVDAAAVNSTLSRREEARTLRRVRRGRAEVVFTTPERLADPDFIATLKRNAIDFLVVDEAHCISQWGHDFRPAFLGIAAAASKLGNPPLLALTATATPQVAEDIARKLGRPRMRILNGGVFRDNLRLAVRQVTNEAERLDALLALIRRNSGAGIVYTATVKAAQMLHRQLKAAGIDALLYHGKLSAADRAAQQEAFMSATAPLLMVATNAFGMGIDKPDIRLVAHYQVPGSLEAYYQEAGRAGRDAKEAHCVLLYDHADRRLQLFFARSHDRSRRETERAKVERIVHYAQSTRCRWQELLDYFAEPSDRPCGHCDNCLRPRPAEARVLAIPAQQAPWKAGDAVEVPQYGRGVVAEHAADRVAVSFADGVTKEFDPQFVSRVP
jgi:ATP-dependent DNA helicase RecQ